MGRRKDKLGQSLFIKEVTLLNKKIEFLKFKFATVELNYLYFETPSPLIQGRTYNYFTFYIKIMRNNMQTNQNDSSLYWFNFLNNRFAPRAQKQMSNCTVLYTFFVRKHWFICKENKFMSVKIDFLPQKEPIIMKEFKEYDFTEQVFYKENIYPKENFLIFQGKFILFIKNENALYTTSIGSFSKKSRVNFLSKEIAQNKSCQFLKNVIMCYSKKTPKPYPKDITLDDRRKNRNFHYEKTLFFEIFMKGGQVFVRELSSFIPNFQNLIFGDALFSSVYENNTFFTFTDRAGDFYAVKSGKKEYLEKNFLPSIKKEWYLDLHFAEITHDTFMILYDNWEAQDIFIWVYSGGSLYYYPTLEFMDDYAKLIDYQVDNYSGTFAVTYLNENGSIRCVLYNFNKNPVKRVLRDFEVFKGGCNPRQFYTNIFTKNNLLYLAFLCNYSNEYKVFVSFIFFGVTLKIEYGKDFYDFTMGKISNELTFQQTAYYDNISIETKPVVYKNINLSKDIIKLETEGLLKLQGDVVKILLITSNPYATFYQRITQVDSQTFIHKKKLDQSTKLSVNNALGGRIRVVTDEYIITDVDRQYNNYYSDCELVGFQAYKFFFEEIDTMYVCNSRKGSMKVFTDFGKVKFEVTEGLGSLEVQSPFLIFVRDSLFICDQTPGAIKVTLSKYIFSEKHFSSLKYVSTTFIQSDETSTQFEELSRVIPMYYPEHDMIYFLFDMMHSQNFLVQGYCVEEDFVSVNDHYKIEPDDDTVPLFYLNTCKIVDFEFKCIVFSTQKVFLYRFFFEIEWKLEQFYEIELFYSLDYLEEEAIIHDENYLVIINSPTKEVEEKERGEDEPSQESVQTIEPNVIIYRFEDDNKNSLFGALYETDLVENPHNDDTEEMFNIVDSALNSEADGETYLYLIMLGITRVKGKARKNKLILKKFRLGEYQLEYDLKSYRYRDEMDFVALDFLQNRVSFKLEAILVSNHNMYVFLFISVACLIILFIMIAIVAYKLWDYRRLKRQVKERIQRDQERVDSTNELMSGLESHFQNELSQGES